MSTPETLTRELAALDDALAGRPVDPDLADLAELAVALRDERPAAGPRLRPHARRAGGAGLPACRERRMPAFSWPRSRCPPSASPRRCCSSS